MNVPLTCPECQKSTIYASATPGDKVSCTGCHGHFEVDAQHQLQGIPFAEAASPTSVEDARSEIWKALDNAEALIWRMIVGIGHFLVRHVPRWIARQVVDVGRIAVKAARLAAVCALWLAITCLPLAVLATHAGWFVRVLALTWTGLAVAGSVWGAYHVRRRIGPLWPWSRRIRQVGATAADD